MSERLEEKVSKILQKKVLGYLDFQSHTLTVSDKEKIEINIRRKGGAFYAYIYWNPNQSSLLTDRKPLVVSTFHLENDSNQQKKIKEIETKIVCNNKLKDILKKVI